MSSTYNAAVIEDVIKAVEYVVGVPRSDWFRTRTRLREHVLCRMLFTYILHERGWYIKAISTALGLHHSSVIHYLNCLSAPDGFLADMMTTAKATFNQRKTAA